MRRRRALLRVFPRGSNRSNAVRFGNTHRCVLGGAQRASSSRRSSTSTPRRSGAPNRNSWAGRCGSSTFVRTSEKQTRNPPYERGSQFFKALCLDHSSRRADYARVVGQRHGPSVRPAVYPDGKVTFDTCPSFFTPLPARLFQCRFNTCSRQEHEESGAGDRRCGRAGCALVKPSVSKNCSALCRRVPNRALRIHVEATEET